MIAIQGKLVSLDLFEEEFACNLVACKGACCVEGDAGAPLKESEKKLMEEAVPVVAEYLSDRAKRSIEKQGAWVERGRTKQLETPLVRGKECAFAYFKNGTAFCSIEKAWMEGKTDFRKPVSCHLYPLRVSNFPGSETVALNYDRWDICSPACENGKEKGLPVFRFLKTPIIREFGQEFYDELELVYREWKKSPTSSSKG